MKVIKISDKTCLALTKQALLDGKTIFYPTDTIYGLGCLASSARAVSKINHIKARDKSRPSLALVGSWAMLSRYARVSPAQLKYLKTIWPGPVTVILEAKLTWPWLNGPDNSIALRLPKHDWLQKLITSVTVPLVSTSANLSGEPVVTHVDELKPSLGKRLPDLAIDAGKLKGQASRLIDLRAFPEIKVIRA